MPQGCEVGVIGSIVGRLQSSVLIMVYIIIDWQNKFMNVVKKG